jgi:MFS family permease
MDDTKRAAGAHERYRPSPNAGIDPPASFAAWASIALLALIFAFGMIDRVIGSVAIGPLKADLRLTDFEFSLTQGAALALFYLAFAIPLGWAADRFSRRAVIFVGIMIWSVASAGTGISRSFTELFAARAGVGAGEAALGPAGYPLIADLVAPKRLGLAVALFLVGGSCGAGLAYLFGGSLLAWLSAKPTPHLWFLGSLKPWQLLFLLTGLPGFVLGPLVLLIPERQKRLSTTPGDRDHGVAEWVGIGGLLIWLKRHRRFYVCHNLGSGFQQISIMSLLSWDAAYMSRYYGWGPATTGMVFGSVMLANSICGLLAHSWGANRMFNRGLTDAHLRWQAATSALAAVLAVFTFGTANASVTVIGFCLLHLSQVGGPALSPTALQLATPRLLRAKASALYVVTTTVLGTAVGPSIVAGLTDFVFHDEKRLGASLLITVVSANLAAAILFWTGRRGMTDAVRASQSLNAQPVKGSTAAGRDTSRDSRRGLIS